ncbi:MAG: sugar transferase [Planctomycetes bacterium]|nr:sugar transferase [Planctomycetota bacterium]
MSEATILSPRSLGLAAARWDDSPRRIRLHDPELTRRLDTLFDEHFGRPRTPSARVRLNHLAKRVLDLTVAVVGLAVLWPALLVAAIATLCDTGRPIFYSQMRRIRFGRQARIYKMRTMFQGADGNLDQLVNIKNNGRFLNVAKAQSSYTRMGRILERLWIVELPQLWNVLKGEMSLVGNRPIPDYVIGVLGPTHEVAERFAGPQGLTGYTQIIGRENVTDEERIQLEYHYSRVFEKGNVFIEDLRIIVITALTYLGLTRRRCAADFLARGAATDSHPGGREVPRPSPFDLGSHGAPMPRPGELRHQPSDGLASLACPTCYVVGKACDPQACRHECVTSCGYSAIRVSGGVAVLNNACVACSACVAACPRQAIDKAPLEPVAEGLHCGRCGTTYPTTDGVFDLLPRRANLEKSPYFDFYESQYVGDNPDVHLEDTEWKLRELRPLIKRDMHYRSLLDVGCGAGVLGRTIAVELGIPQTASTDWSTQILKVARGHAPDAVYVRVDAAYLPLRNHSFDLALLIDVIEHQHKPDQVLAELSRVSGHLLLRTPLEDCWYESVRRRRKDLFRESSGHVVHYHPARIRGQLAANGWEVGSQSVRHIAWSHWRRVLTGRYSPAAKLTAAVRFALRWILPTAVYRRLFVTNYNAFCRSRRAQWAEGAAGGPSPETGRRARMPAPQDSRPAIAPARVATPGTFNPLPCCGGHGGPESPSGHEASREGIKPS